MPVYIVFNHLPQAAATCLARQDDVSKAVAEFIKDRAQGMVPVLSGSLKAGIHLEGEGGTQVSIIADSQHGGAERAYAHYVEYGTRYMGAQPYMGPAAQMGEAAAAGFGRSHLGVQVEAAAASGGVIN